MGQYLQVMQENILLVLIGIVAIVTISKLVKATIKFVFIGVIVVFILYYLGISVNDIQNYV